MLARRTANLLTLGANDRALDRAFFGSYGGKFGAFGVPTNLFAGAAFYGARKVLTPGLRADLAAIEQQTAYGYSISDYGAPISSNFLVNAAQDLPSVGFPLGQFYQPYDDAAAATKALARRERLRFVDSAQSRELMNDSRQRYTGSGIDQGPKSNMQALKDNFNLNVRAFKKQREVFDEVMQMHREIMASPDVANQATVEAAESAEQAFAAVLSLGPAAVAAFSKACKDFATYWGM